MPERTRVALVLLALLGCAQPQKAPPSQQPGRLVRDGREPGTLSVVPVASAPESRHERDASRASMALAPTPGAGKPTAQPAPIPPGEASVPRSSGSAAELRLRERIQNALGRRGSLSYTAKRVSVEVVKRDVVLTGDVRTERERAEVQEIVEKVDGVHKVSNRLLVIDRSSQLGPQVQ